jgi:hypothetical protein
MLEGIIQSKGGFAQIDHHGGRTIGTKHCQSYTIPVTVKYL